MELDKLQKWLSTEEIAKARQLMGQRNTLYNESEVLRKKIEQLQEQMWQLSQEETALLRNAREKKAMEEAQERWRRDREARDQWKTRKCAKVLPNDCPRKNEFRLDDFRGDCPRKIDEPSRTDGDWDKCPGTCKFHGREFDHYDDAGCDWTGDDITISVDRSYCKRAKLISVTPEELAQRYDDCLKNCFRCLNNHGPRRLVGD